MGGIKLGNSKVLMKIIALIMLIVTIISWIINLVMYKCYKNNMISKINLLQISILIFLQIKIHDLFFYFIVHI